MYPLRVTAFKMAAQLQLRLPFFLHLSLPRSRHRINNKAGICSMLSLMLTFSSRHDDDNDDDDDYHESRVNRILLRPILYTKT